MLKEFFYETLELQPSFKSFLGDQSANGEYENTASAEYKDAYKKIIMKYKTILAKEKQQIDLDMMTLSWIIKDEIELLKYKDEWMYITSYDNPIMNFIIDDIYIYPLKTKRDVEDLISRTRKRIPFIKDVIKEMKDGVKEDLTIPKMICKKVVKQIQMILQEQKYYISFPKHLMKHKDEYIRVIDTEYVPVLYEFLEFLKDHVRHCRNSIGLCYIKDGKQMYKDIVKDATTLDIIPEEIFEFGKMEMKKLYQEFGTFKADLMKAMNISHTSSSTMTNRELFKKIIAKDSEYYETSGEILKAYQDAQEKIRKQIIPKYFYSNVHRYNIKRIPKLIEDSSTSAYYYPPAIKSNRRGTVFINTTNIKANPKYAVDTLSLHEGIPGHHYQYQYMKQHHMPIYKMYVSDNDAYAEGWALYCESFMESRDPKLLFGKWIYSMLRTVRLVIDVGIHYYGWSYKRALGYMTRHIPLGEEELKIELDRYICDPGQAVSYKIGERFFFEERDKYLQSKRGDIKDFHREVLECGSVPLEVLKYKLKYGLKC